MGVQQLLLSYGAAEKTYIEDVFNTYLYKGNSSTQSITTNVDMTKGGMIWMKSRTTTDRQNVFDTVRGVGRPIFTNENIAETGPDSTAITSFNNNGWSMGADGAINATNQTYGSWSFRKQKGFFDVVNYTGNGSNRTISHSLGCVPGMILIKQVEGTTNWGVYHHTITAAKYLSLNSNDGANNGSEWFADGTEPTASVFSVGTQDIVNGNGNDYIAYLFGGGESPTARSVDFDGTGDYLSIGASSDLELGTGDFTIETWVKSIDIDLSGVGYKRIFEYGASYSDGMSLYVENNGTIVLSINGSTIIETNASKFLKGQWVHFAIVRASGVLTLYMNGKVLNSASNTTNLDYSGEDVHIGMSPAHGGSSWSGQISNFRVVKGTAVYTATFKPPTEPLTNITNTKLLCCNGSSTTSSTVTPGTITASGDPTASIASPFDDSASFKFGEGGDQNLIKCAGYRGNGSTTGPEVYVGWEPQYLLIKNTSGSGNWIMLDSMRGIITGGGDKYLLADGNDTEAATGSTAKFVNLTSTGFSLHSSSSSVNENNANYVYLAIRRSDGYVGKPANAGTDVFAMDTGANNPPNSFDSAFPVDFAFYKSPAGSGDDWYTSARLTSGTLAALNTTAAEFSNTDTTFDSNVGWNSNSMASSQQSWMWKRHAGFDVVMHAGNSVANTGIIHNLGRTPEMIWTKCRSHAEPWAVYHKGLNGGTTPHDWYIFLNTSDDEDGATGYDGHWGDAPTSSVFYVGNDGAVNNDQKTYISMLFASVDGISKVGSYSGSSSDVTITTGFTPRFVLVKKVNAAAHWHLFDSLRDLDASGTEGRLILNENYAQVTTNDYINTTATGFIMESGVDGDTNGSGGEYIYYAHA